LLQARVRGQSGRAVLRQAPDPLRGKPGGISSQRFGAWRSGGILALPLTRSRKFKFSKNVDMKHFTRHYAKPLLQAGVFVVVFKVLSVVDCDVMQSELKICCL